MTRRRIELKGLSPDQIDRLLPEGLISLCWRGSVAHGMYVPKSDPDSIDDKDVMGVYVRSTLPAEPDAARAERLCVEMISEYHMLSR
jgi:hypothetical protein